MRAAAAPAGPLPKNETRKLRPYRSFTSGSTQRSYRKPRPLADRPLSKIDIENRSRRCGYKTGLCFYLSITAKKD